MKLELTLSACCLVLALAAAAGEPSPAPSSDAGSARREARVKLLEAEISEAEKWLASPAAAGDSSKERRTDSQAKINSNRAEISWLAGKVSLAESQATFDAANGRFTKAGEAIQAFWKEGHKFPFDGPNKAELLKRHETLLAERSAAQAQLDKVAAEHGRVKLLEEILERDGAEALHPAGRAVPPKPKKEKGK